MLLIALSACLIGEKPGSHALEPACTACALTDPNQYRYEASLDAELVRLAAGKDARIDWSALTRDVHGHPRDPEGDIDEAWLVAFGELTAREVLDALASDSLTQSAIALFQICQPEAATCTLSEFGLGGSMLDTSTVFLDEESVWLVVLQSPLEAGGAAFILLQPDSESAVTEVRIDDATSALEAEVDLHSEPALRVARGEPSLVLDWSAVTRDGLGNALHAPSIDGLFLGRFEQSRAELEDRVFDLAGLAAESWTMPLDGTPAADLGALAGATPFRGIEPGSTWLLALSCASCANPAPRLVSFLEPA